MTKQICDILEHRSTAFWLGVLGLLLVLPSLFAGLFADDYNFNVLTNANVDFLQANTASLFDYFTFLTGDDARTERLIQMGLLPWWLDTSMKAVFFRPMSELTHYVDYRWIKLPWLMHLHSLCWYALLLFLLHKIYKVWLDKKILVNLSLLLFVVDATHGFTVGWLANRNAIMAAVFIVLALLCHHQFRKSTRVSDLLGSLVFILLGLLSAEIAISVAAILFAYACFLDKEENGGFPYRAFLSLLPAALLILMWLIAYKGLGFGASSGGGYYNDVFSDTGPFLTNLLTRLPIALSMQFNPLPLHHFPVPGSVILVSGYGVLLVLLGCAIIFKDRLYNFFLLAALLCVLPVLSVDAQERNLLIVGMLACPLFAIILIKLFVFFQKTDGFIRFFSKTAFVILCFGHIFLSAMLMPLYAYSPKLLASNVITLVNSLPESSLNRPIITLGTFTFDMPFLKPVLYFQGREHSSSIINLVTNLQGTKIIRNASNRLHIVNEKGLLTPLDLMFRNPSTQPFRVAELFAVDGCEISIDKVKSDGIPQEITLQCKKDIDEISFFSVKGNKLIPVQLKVGEAINL